MNQVEQTFYAGQVYLEGNYTLYMYVQKKENITGSKYLGRRGYGQAETLHNVAVPFNLYILQNDNQNRFKFCFQFGLP